jgi:hypothetical protein
MTLRSLPAIVAVLSMAFGVAQNAGAQPSSNNKPAAQKPPAPPPPPPATNAKPGSDAPPPPPPAPTPDGRARKVGPNVRIEVTFTEQRSDAPVQAKTVTVTTGDGHWGRVRSQAQSSGIGGTPLNVDARPEVQSDGRLVLSLTLEYGDKRISQVEMPKAPEGVAMVGVPQRNITDVVMNQSVTVLLESGKPLVITQAADPVSDRKVTVEVKATVLR